jgi:hemolysin activation/secretion protein
MPGAVRADTQTPQDRSDPSVLEEELRPRGEVRDRRAGERLEVEDLDLEAALTRPVLIRNVRLEGATALPPAAYASVILPYKGRTLSGAELQDLATAVAQVARNAGYGLASAWVPEQTIEDGLLRIEIDEGRIDDIRIEGEASVAVQRVFDDLTLGAPVRTADLERRLLLAGDLPGVTIDKPRVERIDGRTLLILATRQAAIRGRAYADNWGSDTVGPVRAHLRVDVNGLLAGDDRLTVGGVVTPLDPKEFGLARIAYAKAIGGNGTEITASAYAARSRPGGILSDRDFEGRSLEGSIGINHPFMRSRSVSLWGETEFVVRDAEQSLADVA